jgi:outer membrane biosynthesis protein TonB
VGVLEIVVGKAGDVEFVKLHTPLNRYHERMVVSAAKAWRYRPARKDGKPVRYRLTVAINLPESGS